MRFSGFLGYNKTITFQISTSKFSANTVDSPENDLSEVNANLTLFFMASLAYR